MIIKGGTVATPAPDPLPISKGGHGATTAAKALANLGGASKNYVDALTVTASDPNNDGHVVLSRGSTGGDDPGGGSVVPGEPGEDGATFIPSVSTAGVISWTNDKGLPNPAPVDLVSAVLTALPVAEGVSY